MKKHIVWSEQDITEIAEKMFQRWKENPFATCLQIYKAIKPTLAENIRRNVVAFTVAQVGPLQIAFTTRCRACLAAAEQATEPPPPQIIEVEKVVMPEPFAALAKIPTKLLVAELYERNNNLALLSSPQATSGYSNGPKPCHQEPQVITLPPPERKPRIAVVGLFSKQFDVLAEKVTSARKADMCELKYYDKDKQVEPIRADYCIIQRHTSHTWWDKARATLGDKKHVYFVDGGIEMTFQKVLDILSKQSVIR